MATQFASISDLCARMGRAVPNDDSSEFRQMESLLSDATAELHSVIGGTPILRTTSTADMYPDGHGLNYSFVTLPAAPIVSVESVVDMSGSAVTWTRRWNTVYLPRIGDTVPVRVTFTHGYSEVPEELRKWACVLAASSLRAAEATGGGLGMVAGVDQQSQAIDDYQESWGGTASAQGGATGMTLPSEVAERLAATYGSGYQVVKWG